MAGAVASVVIPAHDEEAVIGRCLDRLLAQAERGEVEVTVVCNGCTDRTADVARRHAPEATVIELTAASKIAALNEGDRASTVFPRFYVDADVELSTESLRRVSSLLANDADRADGDDGAAGEVLCAAPRPEFALGDRPWAIRAFYGIWTQMPYLNDQVVGSGVFALSERGRRRFDEFPEITADDQFVMQSFSRAERRTLTSDVFVVHPPRHLTGLVRIRTRAYRGNNELRQTGLGAHDPPGRPGPALARLARHPRLWPSLAVYLAVNTLAKRRATRSSGWERDDSARAPR